jgi:hypothetical protein
MRGVPHVIKCAPTRLQKAEAEAHLNHLELLTRGQHATLLDGGAWLRHWNVKGCWRAVQAHELDSNAVYALDVLQGSLLSFEIAVVASTPAAAGADGAADRAVLTELRGGVGMDQPSL